MESINTEILISDSKVLTVLGNTASEQYTSEISKRSAWVEVILKCYPLFKEKTTGRNSIDKLTLFYLHYILYVFIYILHTFIYFTFI
jgi:hypothetical protein